MEVDIACSARRRFIEYSMWNERSQPCHTQNSETQKKYGMMNDRKSTMSYRRSHDSANNFAAVVETAVLLFRSAFVLDCTLRDGTSRYFLDMGVVILPCFRQHVSHEYRLDSIKRPLVKPTISKLQMEALAGQSEQGLA
jgi:hypothetical protein